MKHSTATFSLLLATLASQLAAQIAPSELVVATRLFGDQATQLLRADPLTGDFGPLGRFPSDNFPPLAIVVDPVNRDLIVAVDLGGSSRLLRLTLRGDAFVSERTLVEMQGEITDMIIAQAGDVFLTIGGDQGGLYRVPRSGGEASLVADLPRATVVGRFRGFADQLLVIQSGKPGQPAIDPQITRLNLRDGHTETNVLIDHRPFQITGMSDQPTAVVQQLISQEDGSMAITRFFGLPEPLAISPILPPGSAVAMNGASDFSAGSNLVLGGAAHPFLKTFHLYGPDPFVWENMVGPLPGDPVDFSQPSFGTAIDVEYGEACGTDTPLRMLASQPFLGNSLFRINLFNGLPDAPAFLALGLRDQHGILPLTLPSGCDLQVFPDLVLPRPTDASGTAEQIIPIPNDPALAGIIFFAQWFQDAGVPFASSAAIAVQIN